jgi:hypothetical protein
MGQKPQQQHVETTCGSLLRELQNIWDEVGENDSDRDKMLLQLEQECLEVYRRKVDHASQACAQLHQDLANTEAELAALFSALGDPAVSPRVSVCRCLQLLMSGKHRIKAKSFFTILYVSQILHILDISISVFFVHPLSYFDPNFV